MRCITVFILLFMFCANSFAQDTGTLVNALGAGSFKDREAAISALTNSGSDATVPVLEALLAGNLFLRKADQKVFITSLKGEVLLLTDPVAMVAAGEAPKTEFDKIKINNAVRRAVQNAMGGLTLFSADIAVRRKAVASLIKSGDPSALPALEKAMASEKDAALALDMKHAAAAATLNSDKTENEKLQAIALLSARTDRETSALLTGFAATAPQSLKAAALAAAQSIEGGQARWAAVQNVWYGLSLASVLLLAAIGLAITFGVMGVINMAHGEMVMLGAYATFVTQGVIAAHLPQLMPLSLLIAVPVAFLFSGGVGVAIERGIIRFLYGRPLETLLATWGLSLILQQAVRSIFGPTNKEVTQPEWMRGSLEVAGGFSLTMNRVTILVFALLVFFGLMFLIKKTSLGLQMRAVTQNRPMANAMGIRSSWVDALTFGLGSGIAGLAGVALTQIDNVSPNLGQGYIIDSFLVVVFGGVGNLWGTLAGALTLGVANKFLEPFAGAVLGKILILVAVILFIQKRPRGLFALKGRWWKHDGRGIHTHSWNQRQIFITLVLAAGLIVPAFNLLLPATSALHVPDHMVTLIGKYLCYALLALSVDLVWGYCGILSLGHGAFFALGGYAMGMYLMRQIGSRGVYGNADLPDFMVFLNWKELPWYWQGFEYFPFALAMIVVAPGVLAFVFGWLAFRSRVTGVYLSIITQAMTFALLLAFFRNDMGFGGNNGLTDFKDLLGFSIQAPATRGALFMASAVALASCFLVARWIVSSKFGRVLVSIRDAESRTRFLGYRVEHYKALVFTVSAMMAGVAGALYVPQVGIINPSEFSPENSIEAVIWTAFGGRGTLWGAALGAIVVNGAKSWFTGVMPEAWLFMLGGLFIVVTLFMPRGLAGLFSGWRRHLPAPAATIAKTQAAE